MVCQREKKAQIHHKNSSDFLKIPWKSSIFTRQTIGFNPKNLRHLCFPYPKICEFEDHSRFMCPLSWEPKGLGAPRNKAL